MSQQPKGTPKGGQLSPPAGGPQVFLNGELGHFQETHHGCNKRRLLNLWRPVDPKENKT